MIYSAYKLNKRGDNYTALMYSFPNFEAVHCFMYGSDYCFLTCMQVSQEAGKVIWYSHLFKSFPQFVLIHTVKGFSVVNEAEVYVFREFLWFFYDPVDVSNLIFGSSAFSKPSCTSGSSWFTYCWSLAWRILSITLLVWKWVQSYGSCNIICHCPSLDLEWKLTFPSPLATAEFSKFAGMLSVALS